MPAHPGYACTVLMGVVGANPATLRAHRWAVDWKVDEFDVTSFMNFGLGQYETGATGFNLSFDCFWFQADNPHGPLTVIPGAAAGIIIRFGAVSPAGVPTGPTAGDTPRYLFPYCKILTCNTEGAVRDVIRFNFTAQVSIWSIGFRNAIDVPGTNNLRGVNAYSFPRTET